MSRQKELIILGVLLIALFGVLYYYYGPSTDSLRPVAVDALFTPLNVDNPALRTDILKRFLALQYKGVHRSIFSAAMPPPPPPPPSKQPVNAIPQPPPGPPPLTVDAKYFGYVSDTRGSHRRAFFASSNNEDVFIAGEGV